MVLDDSLLKELKRFNIYLEGDILSIIQCNSEEGNAYINECKTKQKETVRGRYELSLQVQKEKRTAEENARKAQENLELANEEKNQVKYLQAEIEEKNRQLIEYASKVETELIQEKKLNLINKQNEQSHSLRTWSMVFLIFIILLFTLKGFIITGIIAVVGSIISDATMDKILVIINSDIRALENITLIITGALVSVFTNQAYKNKGEREDTIITLNDGKLDTTVTTNKWDINYGINDYPRNFNEQEADSNKIIDNDNQPK